MFINKYQRITMSCTWATSGDLVEASGPTNKPTDSSECAIWCWRRSRKIILLAAFERSFVFVLKVMDQVRRRTSCWSVASTSQCHQRACGRPANLCYRSTNIPRVIRNLL